MARIYGNIGFKGLWNGLPVRILMIGTLTAFQWLIYDSFKVPRHRSQPSSLSPTNTRDRYHWVFPQQEATKKPHIQYDQSTNDT